ncbi:unnamed protein product [Protopolystoma xenopodis]|uniref:Uncharacterized protein n=1 Tax=Protopolystoma xenopodis TaxID=117903 RepID=A0A448WX00_9PLAT|nr:unnamed protein product [Protopolystoma xenopodis]
MVMGGKYLEISVRYCLTRVSGTDTEKEICFYHRSSKSFESPASDDLEQDSRPVSLVDIPPLRKTIAHNACFLQHHRFLTWNVPTLVSSTTRRRSA